MKAFFTKLIKYIEEYNAARVEIYAKKGMWL